MLYVLGCSNKTISLIILKVMFLRTLLKFLLYALTTMSNCVNYFNRFSVISLPERGHSPFSIRHFHVSCVPAVSILNSQFSHYLRAGSLRCQLSIIVLSRQAHYPFSIHYSHTTRTKKVSVLNSLFLAYPRKYCLYSQLAILRISR